MKQIKNITVVICAYHPTPAIVKTTNEILAETNAQVLVVYDGISPGTYEYKLPRSRRVHKIVIPTNHGKGYAIKTAIATLKVRTPSTDGIILVDADGQHLIGDIKNMIAELKQSDGGTLIVGIRDFSTVDWIPRSHHRGHQLSHYINKHWFGLDLPDTQCGLRAIPASMFDNMLDIRWNRFEHESAELILAHRSNKLSTIPVTAVYEKDDYQTTVHWFKDWSKLLRMYLYYVFHRKQKF